MAGPVNALVPGSLSTTAPTEIFDFTTANYSNDEDIPSCTITIVAPLRDTHTHTIIFLHGWGDYGSYLLKDFFGSKAFDGRSLAEVFPSVRRRINVKWFDVWDIMVPEGKEELTVPGLQESIGNIVHIIEEEGKMAPLDRIILGGISQGCATAILTLLTSSMDLGGFIGWCSWLPFQKTVENLHAKSSYSKDEISQYFQAIVQMPTRTNAMTLDQTLLTSNELEVEPEAKATGTAETVDETKLETTLGNPSLYSPSVVRTPVFLAHSRDDDIVPFAHGEGLYRTLKYLGIDVVWNDYKDGGHWIHPGKSADDMITFLHRVWCI